MLQRGIRDHSLGVFLVSQSLRPLGVFSARSAARRRREASLHTSRERLDVSLFLRRLVGGYGFHLSRVHLGWRLSLPKEYCVHAVILLIVSAVAAANLFTTSSDRGSLLFALFGESEIEEGPLPRHQGVNVGRGPFLGLVPPAVAGGVSEDDLEFELANTLGGNALIATTSPETAEASDTRRSGSVAYTVRDGDTPSTIAARFGVSTNTVFWANGIAEGEVIRPGDILVIPPGTGVLHKVQEGNDVTSLAAKYDAKVEDIIARNNLDNNGAIRVGQRLFIPDGRVPAPRRVAVAHEQTEEADTTVTQEPPLTPARPGTGLLWPTLSRGISQYFGWRHTGVDNTAPYGSRIVASQSGEVNFAGWLGGYGRLVILGHGSGLTTYYAHMSQSAVKTGDRVVRGQIIGRVGCTGRCTGPHVHWEARVGGRPVNPLGYLR